MLASECNSTQKVFTLIMSNNIFQIKLSNMFVIQLETLVPCVPANVSRLLEVPISTAALMGQ